MSENALLNAVMVSVKVRASVLMCGPVVTQLVTQPPARCAAPPSVADTDLVTPRMTRTGVNWCS